MHTVMTHNNGFDSILLVDLNGAVVSAWTADRETITNYVNDKADVQDWPVGSWPLGSHPDVDYDEATSAIMRTVAGYGDECGRDGEMTDERKVFYKLAN